MPERNWIINVTCYQQKGKFTGFGIRPGLIPVGYFWVVWPWAMYLNLVLPSVKWNNNSTYLRGTLKNIRTCFTWNIRGTWHLHGAVSLPLPFSFLFPLLLWKPWVFNPEGPALVPHLTVSAFSPLWPSTVSLQPAVWPRSGRCYGSPLIAFSSVPFLELRFWAHLCPFTSLSSYFFCRFRIFGRDETSQLPAIST